MALGMTLDGGMETTENNAADLDGGKKRALRARTERMVVIPQIDADGDCIGIYDVHSQSGKTYVVDITQPGRCDCPDMQYNEPESGCKHRRRVAMMFRETDLPRPGENADDYMAALDRTHAALKRELAELLDHVSVLNDLSEPIEASLDE